MILELYIEKYHIGGNIRAARSESFRKSWQELTCF
jgi:hypothetical protein